MTKLLGSIPGAGLICNYNQNDEIVFKNKQYNSYLMHRQLEIYLLSNFV